MDPRSKIKQGRQQETTNDDAAALCCVNFYEHLVQSNMPEENKKVEEEAVDIIITSTENVKDRDQFNDKIVLQVIPKRLERIK